MEVAIIQNKIHSIRGQKVLLDRDLAEMYGVETKVLNQAVKRNIERFEGEDFMFQLTKKEIVVLSRSQIATLNSDENSLRSHIATLNEDENLMFQNGTSSEDSSRSQFVTLKNGRGSNIKYKPYAFTQLGVAMLSSVLNSKIAINANRNIMRAFVLLQQIAANYAELNRKLDDFMIDTNMKFSEVYQAITELIEQKKQNEKPRKRIGYVQDDN